jgi:hypothetical protein
MLDVHAPHQAVRSWMDFLVHIIAITIVTSSMAPYDSAKKNGTVLLVTVLQNWQAATTALAEFSKRFKDFPDSADLGTQLVLPELDALRPVASLIQRTYELAHVPGAERL